MLNTENSISPRISEPPRTVKEFFNYLGPAFIFTAAQIGGGELITVPLLGAYLGMKALFLVPLIAYAKIFGQYYLVQYGVVQGKTFLQACWDKKWMRWMFILLMVGCVLHSMLIAGLLGQTAGTVNFLFPISNEFWILIVIVLGLIIVFTRSYNVLEKTASILLWIFISLITIVAILWWPSLDQWIIGFTPQMPEAIAGLETTSGIMTIAVVFVVLGAGFGPTISYIWYAKDKKMGMFEAIDNNHQLQLEDLTDEEKRRLKGWKDMVLYQNIVSATILSIFSTFIWIAAAQTLHPMGLRPEGWTIIPQMVAIFTSTYGEWSGILFIICGILALFSSIIGPFYGFARLYEESFERFGIYRKFNIDNKALFRIFLLIFAFIPLLFIFVFERPMWLFSTASLLTGPLLGLLYIFPIIISFLDTNKKDSKLRPYRIWAMALAILSGFLLFLFSILGWG
ncbi:MAG: Nramp family divalent metal transporter [Promethearchaeota archaeon]